MTVLVPVLLVVGVLALSLAGKLRAAAACTLVFVLGDATFMLGWVGLEAAFSSHKGGRTWAGGLSLVAGMTAFVALLVLMDAIVTEKPSGKTPVTTACAVVLLAGAAACHWFLLKGLFGDKALGTMTTTAATAVGGAAVVVIVTLGLAQAHRTRSGPTPGHGVGPA